MERAPGRKPGAYPSVGFVFCIRFVIDAWPELVFGLRRRFGESEERLGEHREDLKSSLPIGLCGAAGRLLVEEGAGAGKEFRDARLASREGGPGETLPCEADIGEVGPEREASVREGRDAITQGGVPKGISLRRR